MTHLHSPAHPRSRAFAPRVLTGDRPTGQLHLGHLFGTLLNRVRLQAEGVDLMVLIADYQTITDRDSPKSLPEDVDELVADYLAVGIDPTRATIFAHSLVPELNQLMLPFLSLVTLPELLRNPTVTPGYWGMPEKTVESWRNGWFHTGDLGRMEADGTFYFLDRKKDAASVFGMTALSGLMLTYPVHQAADILFCQATIVPVGADQLPHVEQTRAIARRFNRRYAPERPVFHEPEALLSDAPVLLGTDGGKMSKPAHRVVRRGRSSSSRGADRQPRSRRAQAPRDRGGQRAATANP